MDRAAFIQQHGRIKRVSTTERLVAGLRYPSAPNAPSERPLFAGRFYTTGYVPPTLDPQREDQPWTGVADAKHLTNKWVRKLRAGGCVALQSDVAAPYVPFICDLAAPETAGDGADQLALLLGLAAGDCETRPAGGQSCLFWPDAEAAMYDDELPERSIAHYHQVSGWMEAALAAPVEVRLATAAEEFPVLYGGLRPSGLFVGVMTIWRWG